MSNFFTNYKSKITICVNAFTVSVLIQILIKLYLSLINLKLAFFDNFLSLILIFIISFFFNFYTLFCNFLAEFLKNNLPKTVFETIGFWDEEDRDMTDVVIQIPAYSFFNYFLEYLVYGFIACRLLFIRRPLFAATLKVIITYFFVINQHLFLAYLITFIICISRFVFFLSDRDFSTWFECIKPLLENQQELPKICKKNIKMLTYYSLKGIEDWEFHLYLKDENYIQYSHFVYNFDFKKKFKNDQFIIKKNKLDYLILLFIILLVFMTFNKHEPFFYFSGKLTSSLVIPKTKFESEFNKNMSGHYMICKLKKDGFDKFDMNVCVFTSIKSKHNILHPPKIHLEEPPFHILNTSNFQGINLISIKYKFNFNQFSEILNKFDFSQDFFSKFEPKNLSVTLDWLNNNQIIIPQESFQEFNSSEINVFNLLMRYPDRLPLPVLKGLWSPACTQTFSYEDSLKLLNESKLFLINHRNKDVTQSLISAIVKINLKKKDSYIVKEAQSLDELLWKIKNAKDFSQNNSLIPGYPAPQIDLKEEIIPKNIIKDRFQIEDYISSLFKEFK